MELKEEKCERNCCMGASTGTTINYCWRFNQFSFSISSKKLLRLTILVFQWSCVCDERVVVMLCERPYCVRTQKFRTPILLHRLIPKQCILALLMSNLVPCPPFNSLIVELSDENQGKTSACLSHTLFSGSLLLIKLRLTVGRGYGSWWGISHIKCQKRLFFGKSYCYSPRRIYIAFGEWRKENTPSRRQWKRVYQHAIKTKCILWLQRSWQPNITAKQRGGDSNRQDDASSLKTVRRILDNTVG